MKLGQLLCEDGIRAFALIGNDAYCFDTNVVPSVSSILDKCSESVSLTKAVESVLDYDACDKYAIEELLELGRLTRPVNPPEAWAVGVTYKRQALEHDKDLRKKKGAAEDLYTFVYYNERAEVFFKGLSRTIVGSGEKLYLRPDSQLIMPEAELVLVLGKHGAPVGYTLGNDLTAWDIESECPLYLNQAKIWAGSGSIGPYIIPVESVDSPYVFELTCEVVRGGESVLMSQGSTEGLKRSVEELCYYLNFSNPVESGTVLYTGTTCVIDHDFSLMEGDIVTVSSPLVGALSNPVDKHKRPDKNFTLREEL